MPANGITALRLLPARALTSTAAARKGTCKPQRNNDYWPQGLETTTITALKGTYNPHGTTTRLTPPAISKLTRSHAVTLVVTGTIAYLLVVLKYHHPHCACF